MRPCVNCGPLPGQVKTTFKGRLYMLAVRKKSGKVEYLTRYPMSHEECETMHRKQSRPQDVFFVEVEILYRDDDSVFYQLPKVTP